MFFISSVFQCQSYINDISVSPESLGWREVCSFLKNRGLETSFKKEGLTPLTAAVELNDVELCKKVLAAGVPINQGEAFTETALYRAISKNNEEISLLLIEEGAALDLVDSETFRGYLHLAAANDCMHVCKALIEHGMDINALNRDNRNPLHCAVMFQNERIVRYLLQQKGSNPNQFQKDGWTILHMAVLLRHQGICQALIENGADLNAMNDDLCTPLHIAAQDKNEQLISYFLKKGANARILNKKGDTPLSILQRTLAPFPEDRYLDLKEKDGGLTDLIHSLNLLVHRFSFEEPLFEGSTLIITYREMADSLASYLEDRQISDPFLRELPILFKGSIENQENVDYFMKSIEEGKLTILPAGWHKHRTSLVIWNHLLCKVNRGDASGDEPGFKIYEIQKPSELRSAVKKLFRLDLLPWDDLKNFRGDASAYEALIDEIKNDKIQFFNEGIDKLLELKQLYYLHNNYQQAGNCTWISAKMSFKASLLLFHLQKTPEIKMDAVLKQVKDLYSDWLNFDYVRGLSILPKAMKEPLVNSMINFDAVYILLLNNHLKSKRIALVKVLFQQRPELIQGRFFEEGGSLLHYVNDAKIAALLMQKGAKVDAADIYGNIPLHYLCKRNENTIDTAKVLLARRTAAQINKQNQTGETPLHCLPENNVEMAKLLITKGADINIKNANGDIAAVIVAHPELRG
jgi:ankyrin repeat protein